MSRRSQHRRTSFKKSFAKWTAYMPQAVQDAQRTHVPLPMKKVVR